MNYPCIYEQLFLLFLLFYLAIFWLCYFVLKVKTEGVKIVSNQTMACMKLFTLWFLNFFALIYHLVWKQVMGNNRGEMHIAATHLEKTLRHTHEPEREVPSFARFSLKRLLRMDAEMLPLASRIPVNMASLVRSDSVKPLRNSSSCRRKNINLFLQAEWN